MALTKEQKEARAANHKAAVKETETRAANYQRAVVEGNIRPTKTEDDKKAYLKAYRAAHKAEKAKQDKLRNADPERKAIALERAKAWQKNNPTKARVHSLNRKALNRGAIGKASSDITERRMKQQEGRCAVTNRGSHTPDVTAQTVLTTQAASGAAAIPRCVWPVESASESGCP